MKRNEPAFLSDILNPSARLRRLPPSAPYSACALLPEEVCASAFPTSLFFRMERAVFIYGTASLKPSSVALDYGLPPSDFHMRNAFRFAFVPFPRSPKAFPTGFRSFVCSRTSPGAIADFTLRKSPIPSKRSPFLPKRFSIANFP